MGLREDIDAARDDKERATVRSAYVLAAAQARDASKVPPPVERNGLTLVFDAIPDVVRDKQGAVIGVDAWVRAFRRGEEVQIDPHRRFVNPPTMVPDGTFRTLVNPFTKEEFERPNHREDPWAAYLDELFSSIETAPNPKGWRTRGTVTTVYSGTNDGYAQSTSATYATALSGSGVTVDTGSATYVGQFVSGFYFVLEGFLTFDTSGLPDSDVVSNVDLMLDGASDSSTTDFTMNARDVTSAWTEPLDASDWKTQANLSGYTLLATWATSGYSGGYNTFTPNGSNFNSAIVLTGTTRVILSSARAEAGTTPTGNEYVGFEQADASGTTVDPKLVITHAAAGGVTGNTLYSKTLRSLTQGRVLN